MRKLKIFYLQALYEMLSNLSVSEAAHKLSITQSAMSNILSRLRVEFKDNLLTRSGNLMLRSPRGEELLVELRGLLSEVNMLLSPPKKFRPMLNKASFTLVIGEYFEKKYLPTFIQCTEKYSDKIKFNFKSVTYSTSEHLSLSKDHSVDLFVFSPIPLPYYHSLVLLTSRVVLVYCKNNRNIPENITIEAFKKFNHISLNKSTESESLEAYPDALNDREICFQVNTNAIEFSMLPGTDFVATSTQENAKLYMNEFDIAYTPINFINLKPKGYLNWPIHLDKDPSNLWLRKQLLDIMSIDSDTRKDRVIYEE